MKTWASSFLLLACLAAGRAASAESLVLDAWQLDCSQAQEGSIRAAVMGAALILEPCHISLKLGNFQALPGGAACSLPQAASERAPILAALSRKARHANPRGLSLFILPLQLSSSGDSRYSFSIIEKFKGQARCGDPEPRFLERYGSIFMTDFALDGPDPAFTAMLLAHEVMHELSQRRHPSHAPRGTLLADHLADMGTKISPSDCACMRLSPYLKP